MFVLDGPIKEYDIGGNLGVYRIENAAIDVPRAGAVETSKGQRKGAALWGQCVGHGKSFPPLRVREIFSSSES